MMPKKSRTSSACCPACWLTATAGSPVPRWRVSTTAAGSAMPAAGAMPGKGSGSAAVAPPPTELVESRWGPAASSSAEGRPSRCGWIRLLARRMWRAASTVVGMRAKRAEGEGATTAPTMR